MNKQGFVIVGNDTEVGKTTFACSLLSGAIGAGRKVAAFKPAASGFEEDSPESDFARLSVALDGSMSYEAICPYRFKEPVAPLLAARNMGIELDDRLIDQRLNELFLEYEFLVVETAGGIMSPLSSKRSNLDFAKHTGLPAIVIVNNRLGAINQANLVCLALRSRQIPIAAIIFNQTIAEVDSSLLSSNVELFLEAYEQTFGSAPPETVSVRYNQGLSQRLIEQLLDAWCTGLETPSVVFAELRLFAIVVFVFCVFRRWSCICSTSGRSFRCGCFSGRCWCRIVWSCPAWRSAATRLDLCRIVLAEASVLILLVDHCKFAIDRVLPNAKGDACRHEDHQYDPDHHTDSPA